MATPYCNQVVLLTHKPSSVELLRQHLRTEGYAAITISDPSSAIAAISSRAPDLVILDWSFQAQVFEQVRHCKSNNEFALVVLLDKTGEPSMEEIFQYGADDCIREPFSAREVAARARILLRRRNNNSPRILVCDGIRLDLSASRATVDGVPIRLSVLQIRLLEFFVRNQHVRCSRTLLLKEVWRTSRRTSPRAVDVYVQRLRHLLRASGCHHYIETIRGLGYRFAPSRPTVSTAPGKMKVSTKLSLTVPRTSGLRAN